jgi:hypothetical protein
VKTREQPRLHPAGTFNVKFRNHSARRAGRAEQFPRLPGFAHERPQAPGSLGSTGRSALGSGTDAAREPYTAFSKCCDAWATLSRMDYRCSGSLEQPAERSSRVFTTHNPFRRLSAARCGFHRTIPGDASAHWLRHRSDHPERMADTPVCTPAAGMLSTEDSGHWRHFKCLFLNIFYICGAVHG